MGVDVCERSHTLRVNYRTSHQIRMQADRQLGAEIADVDGNVETTSGHVSISTMPLAKGLEFRAMAVMACDDVIILLQSRIEAVADDADLKAVYNTERHLLDVACTRAREHLLVSGTAPGSEFLEVIGAISGGCLFANADR